MTKLCLIGYGKMGHMIADMAKSHDCVVVSTIDPTQGSSFKEITAEALADADVCIDFSHPGVVLNNIRATLALGRNLVVGTTGWNGALEEVRELTLSTGTGLLYGANYSIGMNLFSRIIADASSLFDKFPGYDVFGYEIHHRQKADSPSGTALELCDKILSHSSRKDSAVYEKLNRRPESHELHFASVRGGNVPGTHVVTFDAEADSIELIHRVRSRSGFASGALLGAKWLAGKKGFFSFSEMISEIIC